MEEFLLHLKKHFGLVGSDSNNSATNRSTESNPLTPNTPTPEMNAPSTESGDSNHEASAVMSDHNAQGSTEDSPAVEESLTKSLPPLCEAALTVPLAPPPFLEVQYKAADSMVVNLSTIFCIMCIPVVDFLIANAWTGESLLIEILDHKVTVLCHFLFILNDVHVSLLIFTCPGWVPGCSELIAEWLLLRGHTKPFTALQMLRVHIMSWHVVVHSAIVTMHLWCPLVVELKITVTCVQINVYFRELLSRPWEWFCNVQCL